MRVIYVLAAALSLSVFANVVLALRPTHPTYFASSDDGRIVPIVPLSRPVMSSNALDNWVTTAVTNSLQISFSTYRSDLESSKQYFTDAGFRAFTSQITESQLLGSILANRYNEFAVMGGAPVLLSVPGAVDKTGAAYWIWQVPVSVTLESADAKFTAGHTVTVTVVRVPQTDNPSGLGITDFIEQ
jgi:intracellular multiplication protein IcmL